jgi:hypothetical protein
MSESTGGLTSACTRPPRARLSSTLCGAARDARRSAARVLKSRSRAWRYRTARGPFTSTRPRLIEGPRFVLPSAGRYGRCAASGEVVGGSRVILQWCTRTTACTRRPRSVRFMNLGCGAGDAGRYGSAPRSDRLAGRLRAVASRRSWAIFEARLRYSFGGGFHLA